MSSITAAKFLYDMQQCFDFPAICIQTDGATKTSKSLEKIPDTVYCPYSLKHQLERIHRTDDAESYFFHGPPTDVSELSRFLA